MDECRIPWGFSWEMLPRLRGFFGFVMYPLLFGIVWYQMKSGRVHAISVVVKSELNWIIILLPSVQVYFWCALELVASLMKADCYLSRVSFVTTGLEPYPSRLWWNGLIHSTIKNSLVDKLLLKKTSQFGSLLPLCLFLQPVFCWSISFRLFSPVMLDRWWY